MNKKNLAVIAGIMLILIASVGSVCAFDLFGKSTNFENKFMSGTFDGVVAHNKIDDNTSFADWVDSYEDRDRNITYNMSCIKGGSFMTEMYQLQGLNPPERRNFNGQDWKIYYSQAAPTNANGTEDTNNSALIHVYICEADVDNVTYSINIMAYDNKTVDCDGTLYCDYFKNTIQPLLESIKLKDGKKAPQIYKVLNMSKDDFNSLQDYIEQVKAGNVSATA